MCFACGGVEAQSVAQTTTTTTTTGAGTSAEGAAVPSGGQGLAPPMQQALQAHNLARAEHCAPLLEWSPALASAAAAWADTLVARGCQFEHSQSPYGENLFMGTAGRSSPSDVVTAWVSERSQYDFRNGGFSMQTGHFTQVVWASTRRLGCAVRTCGEMDLWVCNYDSPGNVQGGYPQNVQPTSCR